MKNSLLKTNPTVGIIILLLISYTFLCSGCELALLGIEGEEAMMLAEGAEDAALLRTAGVEVESVGGRLMIAEDEAAFNTKLENIKLNESNELYMMKKGKPKEFAELVDEENIKLTEAPFKNVNLGGKLYTVRGSNVFVRSTPIYDVSNSNCISQYSTGR